MRNAFVRKLESFTPLSRDQRHVIQALTARVQVFGPRETLLGVMDHSIGTITPARIAKVPAQAIRDLTADWPELAEALWWQTLVAIEIQREWTMSLGRRTAVERLAHLLCEIVARLAEVGLSDGSGCGLPLTPIDIADATGLSKLHVNRSIQQLRARGLIELRDRRLTIRDRPGWEALGMFSPTYLHRRTDPA